MRVAQKTPFDELHKMVLAGKHVLTYDFDSKMTDWQIANHYDYFMPKH